MIIDGYQSHMLTDALRSFGEPFVPFDLFDDSVIGLLDLLNSFLSEIIRVRSSYFAPDVILSVIIFVIAQPLLVCNR